MFDQFEARRKKNKASKERKFARTHGAIHVVVPRDPSQKRLMSRVTQHR